LGIYIVNVQAFAMIPQAYQNSSLALDFGPDARAAARLILVGFEGKFITIFSALFGAGMVLMAGRGDDPARVDLHRRRMGWLALIGVIHAYGLWFGDILLPYAVAGLLLVGALKWETARLVWVGLALTAATSLLFGLLVLAAAVAPPEDYAEMIGDSWALTPEAAESWRETFRSNWLARAPRVIGYTFEAQMSTLVVFMPRIVGVMMIGMALFRSGFFSGGWSIGRLAAAAALAPIGLAGSWIGAEICFAANFDFLECAPGMLLGDVASAVQALGYAAIVMLLCRVPWLALVRAPFAATGRMAITNYLGCTVFSVLLFYGPPGLGQIGTFNHVGQVRLALLVWVFMLVFSTVWLAVFRFGPVEWAWRSLTYRRLQPMLKRGS
jgi:uncharacterized protein